MKKLFTIVMFCAMIHPSFAQWSNTGNNETQGAVKLKDYLLFDADGDFTGANYFTIQDSPSGNYLRFGYGFSNHMVIKSSGNIGIGTINPNHRLEVETTGANNNTEYLIGAFNHAGSNGGVYLGYVGDGTGSKQGRLRAGGNVDLALGTTSFREAIVINDSNGDVAVGRNTTTITGTGGTDLVVGNAGTSRGIVINGGSSGDGILSFASDGALSSRLIYNNGSGTLHFHKPSTGNLLSINNTEMDLKTRLSLVGGLGDLISLYDDRIGNANMYGFGIETNGGTLYNKAVSGYNWYLNKNADQGAGAIMKLNSTELVVDARIRSEEIKVEVVNGADFVFEPDYDLRSLKETKQFIEEHKHLPEIAPAREMEAEGLDLGKMNIKLLQKIEELTLYQIQLLERLEKAEKEIVELKKDK